MLTCNQLDPGVFIVVLTVLALFIGSFLNVVIHRLPKMMEQDWRAPVSYTHLTLPTTPYV